MSSDTSISSKTKGSRRHHEPLAYMAKTLKLASAFCLRSYVEVYRELEHAIVSSSALEDLSWFSSSHGPGMHMNWPQFEVRRIPLQDNGVKTAVSPVSSHSVSAGW